MTVLHVEVNSKFMLLEADEPCIWLVVSGTPDLVLSVDTSVLPSVIVESEFQYEFETSPKLYPTRPPTSDSPVTFPVEYEFEILPSLL